VLDALAAGVPIVVLPIAFEQGAIAARVTRAGAGTTVSPRFLTRRRLARAIRTVIEDPAYARAAARLGAEIRAAGGVSRAANIVEKVVATGRPVLRDEPAAPLPQERARMTA
jgi:zeaxanthin glucosyltransferase